MSVSVLQCPNRGDKQMKQATKQPTTISFNFGGNVKNVKGLRRDNVH